MILYDSDNIDDIPVTAEGVMFYNDQEPGTPTVQQLERFNGKVLVPITRRFGVSGKVADCEPGCIWPPTQVVEHFKQGHSDTLYCGANNLPAVGLAFDQAKVARPPLIVANYNDQPVVPQIPGWVVVGHQYINPPLSEGHYDLTVTVADWPIPHGGPVELPPDEPVEAPGGDHLDSPVVDAVWVVGGCYMVTAHGEVFCRDAAKYHGGINTLQPPIKLAADICSILVQDHSGYTLVAEDGGTFRFANGPEVQPL